MVCRSDIGPVYDECSGESMWRTSAASRADSADDSESSGTDSTSFAECRSVRPSQHRTRSIADSGGCFHDEFKCRQEVWFRRTRTSRNARRPSNQRTVGVSGSLKPVHASPGDPAGALRSSREYPLLAGCSFASIMGSLVMHRSSLRWSASFFKKSWPWSEPARLVFTRKRQKHEHDLG